MNFLNILFNKVNKVNKNKFSLFSLYKHSEDFYFITKREVYLKFFIKEYLLYIPTDYMNDYRFTLDDIIYRLETDSFMVNRNYKINKPNSIYNFNTIQELKEHFIEEFIWSE